jgi:hypothetical protein
VRRRLYAICATRMTVSYRSHPIPPFVATVGYVRGLKIGGLCIWCEGKREGDWPCHHTAEMSIDGFADDMPIASIERRLRCQKCGPRGKVDVRPDWSELTAHPPSQSVGWIMPADGSAKT